MKSNMIILSILAAASISTTSASASSIDSLTFENLTGKKTSDLNFFISSESNDSALYFTLSDTNVLIHKLEPKKSKFSSFVDFFHNKPLVGEIIVVNSQPRIILDINEDSGDIVFSDLDWSLIS